MRVTIVVREVGSNRPDYSLDFEVPAVPAVGSYVSIVRADAKYGHTEDLIVRHVWWRLSHPETGGFASDPPKIGNLVDVQVECDPAIGPNSLDRWRDSLESARARGIDIAEFDIARFNVREDEMP